eukprot:TRINITY_DN103803_c0_g1_i2.p1 TRINITY_DN103803_c0_g1~~TRINITY_DN103803_c0_g1_i2.p1  ORF type:complete len:296 (-),score=56.27 TRINITY_DN103803_c0_g1_i2:127-993(-)
MSELRQRKGEVATEPNECIALEGGAQSNVVQTQNSSEEVSEKLFSMIERLNPKPKPGTSNEAQRIKDQLKLKPFDMNLMFELGKAYANDYQWERCDNVLLRGFKRVQELDDASMRFEFLAVLCTASLRLHKHKQALAVLNDMEMPEDPALRHAFFIQQCQVYAFNGATDKCLKAFNRALEGNDFAAAVQVWIGCSQALKKIDSWAVAKAAIEKLATTDAERVQLESIDKVCAIKDEYLDSSAYLNYWESTQGHLTIALIALGIFALLVIVWWLEQWNLKRGIWDKRPA